MNTKDQTPEVIKKLSEIDEKIAKLSEDISKIKDIVYENRFSQMKHNIKHSQFEIYSEKLKHSLKNNAGCIFDLDLYLDSLKNEPLKNKTDDDHLKDEISSYIIMILKEDFLSNIKDPENKIDIHPACLDLNLIDEKNKTFLKKRTYSSCPLKKKTI